MESSLNTETITTNNTTEPGQVESLPDQSAADAAPERVQNLYEKLVEFDLERKLVEISIAEAKVPPSLKDEAAQEIRIDWLKAKVKAQYTKGEVASYAYRIGCHSALRVRRELGSAVRLPGSAFRKRKNGESYVSPGVLAAPLDWDDMEEWLVTNDDDDSKMHTLSIPRLLECQLTPRQKQIVVLLSQGMSFQDIMSSLNIKKGTFHREVTAIKTHISKDK
jgi:hypothetical protein